MAEIYPSKESRIALEVFRLYQGYGEYFDLSTKPIMRQSFVIGKDIDLENNSAFGYFINEKCIGCAKCCSLCPQNCIDKTKIPFVIHQENCLHCGNCMSACKYGAVEKR